MGKRSSFERRERDFYPTPKEAVLPLLPFISSVRFAEPCAGDGRLSDHLMSFGHEWMFQCDIEPRGPFIAQRDAFDIKHEDMLHVDYIITNPPWDRSILHPMINHLKELRPTWLLFDADWMHTKQSSEYIKYCSKIVSIGRVKWIPDSKMTGKDNCCWYLFQKEKQNTEFIGR